MYRLDRSGDVLERTPGLKQVAIRSLADGGTIEEQLRNPPPHGVAVCRDLRRLRQHRDIDVRHGETPVPQQRQHLRDEDAAVRASPPGVGVPEVLTDVAQAGCAQQRIAQRMQHHVAVRMRQDSARVGNADASQHDEVAGTKRVHVES